ncbi:MAG: TMEM165/GDT1 family protein [Chitinivibrionales bacterium]
MDVKLFFSTFALIFLAELGDKTQLASMAASAGSRSPWSVFCGAASALVLSTLVAVLVGSTLQRYIPQHIIRGAAAIIFFLFGAFLLISAIRSRPAEAVEIEEATAKASLMGRLFITIAHDFEKSSSLDYQKLASEAKNDAQRALFSHLAEEERSHLDHIAGMAHEAKGEEWEVPSEHPKPVKAPVSLAEKTDSDSIVSAAIEHEKNTAAFYRTLARLAPLASIRSASLRLAEEEDSHVAHLEEYVRYGTFGHQSDLDNSGNISSR